jgi:hypothetical protein
VAWILERTIPTKRLPLVGEVSANFMWIEVERWSAWRIPITASRLSRQEPLLFYKVALQLYSRGWVDPVPDPLFFRKCGSARNRTLNLDPRGTALARPISSSKFKSPLVREGVPPQATRSCQTENKILVMGSWHQDFTSLVWWLRLAPSKRTNRVDVFLPSPKDRNRSNFRCVAFF